MNSTRSVRHILVAHDLTETSDGPLAHALALAKQLGARVAVFHAYEVPSMGGPEVLMLATEWADQIGVVAREKLEEIVVRAGDSGGVSIASDLRKGSVWREVDHCEREHDVDPIVVESHRRRGLPRALLATALEAGDFGRCSVADLDEWPSGRSIPVGEERHRALDRHPGRAAARPAEESLTPAARPAAHLTGGAWPG